MGVKDLWNVLGPLSHKIPLYDLQDKAIAVDLSCWVCEGQIIGEKTAHAQPRMYLRTVFFRTCTLLMMNVKPIFVMDGQAPSMKLNVMKQRNDARFRKVRDPVDENKAGACSRGGRSRFSGIIKQCREMLEIMGVPCVQSPGEAEALCAQLNKEGVVDGVITQDSDVFLYGAETVYRNLIIKAGTGTVDAFTLNDIETKLNLNREKLIAMSLLCGCDYDQSGLHGVGKDLAFKYLTSFDGDALEHLRGLRSNEVLQRLEEEKNGCTRCCHPGKLSEHKKDGCTLCGRSKGCDENLSPLSFKNLNDDEKKKVSLELSLRRKALQDPNFPNEATISEYLGSKTYQKIHANWKRPNVHKFVIFCEKMLEWETEYAFEKILPLYTRWLLLFSSSFLDLVPEKIFKKRVVKGVPSLDIGWKATDENIIGLMSEKFIAEGLCLTTEPTVLVSEKCPKLYTDFMETKVKKSGGKKKKIKKKENCELSKLLDDLKINEVEDLLESSCIFEGNYGPPDPLDSLLPSRSIFSRNLDIRPAPLHFSSPKTPNANFNISFNFSSGVIESPKKSKSVNDSIILTDDSTQDYDVSAIVDEIISRKQFY